MKQIKVNKEFFIISDSKKYIIEKGDIVEVYADVSQLKTYPSPMYYDYLTLIKNVGFNILPDRSDIVIKQGKYRFTYGPHDSYRLGNNILTNVDFQFLCDNGYFVEY